MRIAAPVSDAGSEWQVLAGIERDVRQVASLSSEDYDQSTTGYPWMLASFAHTAARPAKLPERVAGASMVWIDSGAFTVWQTGGRIDLRLYIRYLKRLRHVLPCPIVPINLDVIPGEKRRAPTAAEAGKALREGMRNATRIREAGLPVMEVWHRGEPLDQLRVLLDRRQPGEVLGVGGLVGLLPRQITEVCDPIFRHLLDAYPHDKLPPLHGLGVGNRNVLFRYPWWSCDSSSWLAPGVWGRTIQRSGNTVRKGDPRIKARSMRFAECAKILRQWHQWEHDLERLWTSRGIRFDQPPEDQP